MNIAMILAGGTGSRVGGPKPKQFLEVLGKPVLAYTIEIFQNHPQIDAVEVVCVDGYLGELRQMVAEYGFSKVKWIVRGGGTFQESVICGVEHLRGEARQEDLILIHYGASPFVSGDIISDSICVCAKKGNCVSATPCFQLMGSNDDGKQSTQWVDRDRVMQLNCPQCFTYGYVSQLYQEARETGLLERVEPHTTSLMYAMGRTIYFSKGNQVNIKITTKEDLFLFEGYVRMKQNKALLTWKGDNR